MRNVKNFNYVDDRMLFGIIADEATVIGFLMAGIGESFGVFRKNRSFLIVKEGTSVTEVQNFFVTLYNRTYIGIILVGSDLLKHILPLMETVVYKDLPIILEIATRSSLTKPFVLKQQDDHRNSHKKSEKNAHS